MDFKLSHHQSCKCKFREEGCGILCKSLVGMLYLFAVPADLTTWKCKHLVFLLSSMSIDTI